jgi:precorrin-2/cobalt-factor-2 C20-methyltransferase
MTGTLTGVGVGPGDPELITLKALRVLERAPVIAYPATEKGDSLARRIAAPHIPAGRIEIALPFDIARTHAENEAHYDRAAERIAAELSQDRDVAALCEGDPLVYGSFAYLAERLAGRFPVAVVPGITSVTAAGAAAGRALVSGLESLTVLPASLPEDALVRAIDGAPAVAVLKLGRHFAKAKRALKAADLLEHAMLAVRVGLSDQRIMKASEVGDDEAIPYFAILITRRANGR